MKKIIFLIFVSLALLVAASPAPAANFLKIEGIEGDTNEQNHPNEIAVVSWSWQMSMPGTVVTGVDREAAKPIVRPLLINKEIDKASPEIAIALLEGQIIPEAILSVTAAMGDAGRVDILVITMRNVQIVHQSNEADPVVGVVSESVALTFSDICYKFLPMNPDGSPGAPIEKCWDIAENRATN